MIARLRTLCGCEKLVDVSGPQPEIRMVMMNRLSTALLVPEGTETTMEAPSFQYITFRFEEFIDSGQTTRIGLYIEVPPRS